MENKKSGLATASMVLGIIGIVLSFIPIINNVAFVLGILAIIFGIIPLVKKAGKGKAIAGLVLGILAVVITLALQSSWSKALDETSEKLDKMTGERTEDVLKEDVQVTFGAFEVSTDEYGFTSTKLPVTVTNIGDEKKSFDVSVEAVDSSGNRIDTDRIYASDLNAGQSQTLNAFEFISDEILEQMENATFDVVEASVY